MTIEAKGKWYGIVPVGSSELTRFDGELTLIHLGSKLSFSAIRVLSDNEFAIFPYIPTNEPNIFKKGEPEVLVCEQITEANIRGRILEKNPSIQVKINWRP